MNLDFELGALPGQDAVHGWRTSGADGATEIDATNGRSATRGLRVTQTESGSFTRFSQDMDTERIGGNRVRLSAYIRSDAESSGTAMLWIRVDGDDGLFYVDRTPGLAPGTDWSRWELDAPLGPPARRISIGGEFRGAGTVWFDDFALEPVLTSELPPPSATAERYIDRALELIDANAVTRGQLDWPAYRLSVIEQARGAESIEDSYLALRFALSSLGDQHSYLMTSRQMDLLAERPVGNARTGRDPTAPRGEMLAGSIAYLMLPGFAGGAHADQVQFAEGLHDVIADLDARAACGWIVDLRNNSGGNLWPMLAGIGPLLGDGEAGASVRPNGERTALWYREGKVGLGDYVQLRVAGDPYRLREVNPPVAVLTGRSTASAAEIVATAFEARPGSRSFGAATSGATTGTQIFPLSDGAALVLAVAATSDRNGRIYAGRIEPDVAVAEDRRGAELPEQVTVRAASEWLRAQTACVRNSLR
jgi:hypothetical protein